MKNQRHYIIQFVCVIVLFAAIMLQGLTGMVKTKPLRGYVKEAGIVPLTFESYYNGSYQASLTDQAKQKTGFREFFIRFYNQALYSCFHKITNDNIVEGRDRELFLAMYLEEITGKKFESAFGSIDEAKAMAENNVKETLRLIDTLHQHGKEFLFVFAPTKTAVYRDKLLRSYQKRVSNFSLEEYYIELFQKYNIPHVDLYHYFLDIRDTVSYPLYTRLASHWAESTIPFVADTILRKIESLTGYHLPGIQVTDLNVTSEYSDYDKELELTMNLLLPWPKPALPKPVFSLQDTTGKDRPRLLVIGDSYFDQLMFSCFRDVFRNWDFWQYMLNVYSSRNYWGEPYADIYDAPKVLQEADVVMAIFTAPMLYKYMYDFPEKAFTMINTPDIEVLGIMEYIRREPEWMEKVVEQAEKRGITIEENLRINAEYYIDQTKNH